MNDDQMKSVGLKVSRITVTWNPAYHTNDLIAAQAAAGKKIKTEFVLYLANRICLFDGQRLAASEIRERLKGSDYLQLQGALLGDGEEDEDEAGN